MKLIVGTILNRYKSDFQKNQLEGKKKKLKLPHPKYFPKLLWVK